MDFDGPDGPYRLVGWGYLVPFQPDSKPPRMACVAESEWFVHEAGFHLKDGGMIVTPEAPSVEPAPPSDAAVHFWHPRIWDLHMWAGADGVAIVAYDNPNAREGGVKLPDAAFLHHHDGELVPVTGARH